MIRERAAAGTQQSPRQTVAADRLNVRGRLFLSEAAAVLVVMATLGPYLIVTSSFNSQETTTYLVIVLLVAVGVVVGSYYSVGRLTSPILRFIAAETAAEGGPSGASLEIVDEARAAALNLPILFTLNVLLRYEAGATLTALGVLVTGTLSLDRTVALELKAIVGLLVPTLFMFFVCERTIRPVRQHMALRCRGLRGLSDDRIIRIGVVTRLVVVVLLMMALPLLALSSLDYQTLVQFQAPMPGFDPWLAAGTVFVFSLIIGGAVAVLLAQSISEPLNRAAKIMGEVGSGNLGLRVDVLTSDETGILSESFNQMIDQVEDSENQLRGANRQILELNRDLERKVAERTRELAEVANRNRVILQSIGDGVIVFDAGQLAVMANPAVRDVLGLAPETVLGHRVDSIVGSEGTPAERDRSLAILTGMLATRGSDPKPVTVVVKFKLGDRIVSTSFAPIEGTVGELGDLGGGLVAVFRDTTEMEQMTADLARANAELVQANRHKSEFLANMSHELRTPLNAIIGFSELLHEQAFGTLNAKQARYVENINTSGQHLLRLINDILDLSKVEAGKLQVDRRIVQVAPVLREVQTMMKPLADRKKLALDLDMGREVSTVFADEGMLRQVLINLLSNAIKFTDKGRVSVEATAANGLVRIAVSDTGIGIAPDDLGRLFKEFQQLDGSSTRRHEGTGLGLALSKRLVELQGGEMFVQSAFGVGSVFGFTLPVVEVTE